MIKKIIITLIIIAIVIVLIYFYIVIMKQRKARPESDYFPSTPTQEEREAAKKIPREECPCWDGINNICLPQADCI